MLWLEKITWYDFSSLTFTEACSVASHVSCPGGCSMYIWILLLSDGMLYKYHLRPSDLMWHLRAVFFYSVWMILRESQLPGLWVNVECAEQIPKVLGLTTSSPCSLTPPLQSYVYLGHPSLLRNPGGCTLRMEASVGDHLPHGSGYLVTWPWSLRPDSRVTVRVHREDDTVQV